MYSIEVVFYLGFLPFLSSSFEVVFLWGHLPARLSNNQVLFHWGRLPLRSSSIEVVFNWGRFQLRSSSIEVVFHLNALFNIIIFIYIKVFSLLKAEQKHFIINLWSCPAWIKTIYRARHCSHCSLTSTVHSLLILFAYSYLLLLYILINLYIIILNMYTIICSLGLNVPEMTQKKKKSETNPWLLFCSVSTEARLTFYIKAL